MPCNDRAILFISLFSTLIPLFACLAVVSMTGYTMQYQPLHAIKCFFYLTDQCGQLLEYRRAFRPVVIMACIATLRALVIKLIKRDIKHLFG